MSETKKTALVTGAGKGLGKGFVEYLTDQDYFVFAGVRNISEVDSTMTTMQNVKVIEMDVSKDESITSAIEEIKKMYDHIDLLINNAGVNKDTATNNHKEIVCNLEDLQRESMLTMFNVNAISPMIVLQKCLPLLVNNPCFVINISSGRASYNDENANTSGNYGYRASKAALNMMTFCSLFDIPDNVRTFSVHPGSIKTDMNPSGLQLPYDQAQAIIDITRDWKESFNGRFLRYDETMYPL